MRLSHAWNPTSSATLMAMVLVFLFGPIQRTCWILVPWSWYSTHYLFENIHITLLSLRCSQHLMHCSSRRSQVSLCKDIHQLACSPNKRNAHQPNRPAIDVCHQVAALLARLELPRSLTKHSSFPFMSRYTCKTNALLCFQTIHASS